MRGEVFSWCMWWDAAILVAQAEAAFTGRRHRVYRFMDRWIVEPVGDPGTGFYL